MRFARPYPRSLIAVLVIAGLVLAGGLASLAVVGGTVAFHVWPIEPKAARPPVLVLDPPNARGTTGPPIVLPALVRAGRATAHRPTVIVTPAGPAIGAPLIAPAAGPAPSAVVPLPSSSPTAPRPSATSPPLQVA